MTEGLTFGEALELLKQGKRVCSKHMHTLGINSYELDDDKHYLITSDGNMDYSYAIATLSVEEMLLEDWYEVKEEDSSNDNE